VCEKVSGQQPRPFRLSTDIAGISRLRVQTALARARRKVFLQPKQTPKANCEPMKTTNFKKFIVAGLAVAGLALTPALHADVQVFLEGGSASQSVIYDRATNLFNGGSFTVTGGGSSAIAQFSGTSGNPSLSGYGTITLDINLNNGAIDGLQALVNQVAGPQDTNYTSGPLTPQIPTFVDSATTPDVVGVNSSGLTALPTYVVPLVFIKNTNSADTAAITNLTQRQAWSLENSLLTANYYGGNSTNYVYFVGRNLEAAVRTEIDLNIYNSQTINTYYTNGVSNTPLLDTSSDPGLTSGGTVANTVIALTNSIGTVAVQNIKKGLAAISYEGVPYSVTNVINGSYPLWGYENYYYITSGQGTPSAQQLAVINAFYGLVTNATFQATSKVFVGNFIPNASLQVSRGSDGGQITPLPGFFQ
jgi:hypothetical protein